MGAGVAVAPDAVLTAHYLVLGAARVQVTGADGRTRAVRRIALNHESGLALLSLDGDRLRSGRRAPRRRPRPGRRSSCSPARASSERKGATGHVSVVGPFEAFWEYMLDRAIMTTAINPGLAGAPLFRRRGPRVGIVSLGLAAVARYSLAIPVDLFVARRAQTGERGRPRPPRRAWVGLLPAGARRRRRDHAAWCRAGPRRSAGLVRGDLILSVDGEPVSSLRELYRALWRKGPGDPLGMQVLRDSAIHVVEIVAGDRYEFYK